MRKHETPAVLSPLVERGSNMPKYAAHKVASIPVGLICAGLSSYGAYEFQLKLEGSVNYLVVAAPFVVASAALIPVLAEATWRDRQWGKSLLWWLVLIPAAALAFYAAAERVHLSKAGAEAERIASRGAVTRAEATLSEAREALKATLAKQSEALHLRACREECQAKWQGKVDTARKAVADAEAKVSDKEAKAVTEAPFKAPTWLLPLCLDLIGFMAIWTAFGAARVMPSEYDNCAKRKRGARRTRRSPAKRRPSLDRVICRVSNDNVSAFPSVW